MADQKKWFKVWMSILTDPHFINLSCKQSGRWTRLGALLCQQGTDGKLVIRPPSLTYQEWFEVESFADLIMCIKELPNVQIQPLENDNGEYIVIMLNWRKYQLDSTGYERLKRSRYKRREREDKTLTSKSTSSSPPAARRASLDATRLPLAGEHRENGDPEFDAEKLEQEEANRTWQRDTKNSAKAATPEEVREIMNEWRQANPRGGKP